MLPLLRHGQFRLLWFAGAFGDMSLSTYFTVHGWLALELTGSPFWVGASAGVGGLAMAIAAPYGGVLIDRFPTVHVVRASSMVRGIAAVVLAVLIFTDSIEMWHVLLMSLAGGVTGAVRMPGMMTLNLDIAGRENLLSANAVRFASMTGIGVVAPLLIGPVIDGPGIAWAYIVISAGDALFILLMSFLRPLPRQRASQSSTLSDLRSGISYAITTPLVRTILGVILINELFGWAHEPMLPVIASDTLRGGATTLGTLLAAAHAGAAISSITLSAFGDVRNKAWFMVVGVVGYGVFLLMFSFSRSLPISMVLLALTWGTASVYEAMANTVLQTGVRSEMRGRVLSFQAMMWGLTGVTGFHTGAVAQYAGAPVAVGIGAALVIANGLRFATKARSVIPADRPRASSRSVG